MPPEKIVVSLNTVPGFLTITSDGNPLVIHLLNRAFAQTDTGQRVLAPEIVSAISHPDLMVRGRRARQISAEARQLLQDPNIPPRALEVLNALAAYNNPTYSHRSSPS